MLGNDYFYNKTTIKYIWLFGSLFNNLIIQRSIKDQTTQIINVPIQYAKKEKMLTRVLSDPAIQREDAITLPVMSFEIKNITYDGNRHLPATGRTAYNLSNTSINFLYNPVPYNISMALYIYVKNNEDGTKILEQILPFFTPDFTVKAVMMQGLESISVPIILDGVLSPAEDDTDLKDRNIIVWTLAFTIKGQYYGPVRKSPVIDTVNLTISVENPPAQNTTYKVFGMEDLEDAGLEP